jgi:hypothetical protein
VSGAFSDLLGLGVAVEFFFSPATGSNLPSTTWAQRKRRNRGWRILFSLGRLLRLASEEELCGWVDLRFEVVSMEVEVVGVGGGFEGQ